MILIKKYPDIFFVRKACGKCLIVNLLLRAFVDLMFVNIYEFLVFVCYQTNKSK